MKVRCDFNGFEIEEECGDIKDVFDFLGSVQEVFQYDTCGKCKQPARPEHRKAQGYDFYSMVCSSCKAEFSFGQRRDDGHLFPKTKDESGQVLPDGGWYHYTGGSGSSAPPKPQGAAPSGDHVPF